MNKKQCFGFGLALVLSLACGGESDKNEALTAAKASEAPVTATGVVDTSNPAAATSTPTVDETASSLCASPCRLLSKYSLEELRGKGYCNICGSADANACGGENPFSASTCDQHDFLRNCVYANRGYAFKKTKWQERFGAFDWYKVRSDFSESEFSKTESRNIAALRQQAGVCASKTGAAKVAHADQERVRSFVKKLASGKAQLETIRVFDENGLVESGELGEFRAALKDQVADDYFTLEGAATRFRYAKASWAGGAIPKGHRVIELAAGVVPDEHDWFVHLLVSDAGKNKGAYIYAL